MSNIKTVNFFSEYRLLKLVSTKKTIAPGAYDLESPNNEIKRYIVEESHQKTQKMNIHFQSK